MQFITSDLVSRVTATMIPKLVTTRNWKTAAGVRTPSLVMQWAVKAPKTALLLWMCGEVDSWPSAAIYGLDDKNLPYREEDLNLIAQNPAYVVEVQWKVAMKQLPRGGEHVEFQTQNTVPLLVERSIGPRTPVLTKSLAKVKFRDGSDNNFYVRKRLEINLNRPQDKAAILSQIKQFHTLDHKNIAKIVSSYAQGLVVAFITPYMEYSNLEDYLDTFSGFSQSDRILSWITDLSSALAYIHAQKMEHKNIRPQKILVDSQDRIFFSVFGVMLPVRTSYAHVYEKYSTDPAYIYAAPEVISRESKVRWQLADIFSLGCVFFEMVGKAKGKAVEDLRSARAAATHDQSFHMNLNYVLSMTEQLRTMKLNVSAQRRVRIVEGSKRVLAVVKHMLNADASARPSMQQILDHLTKPRPPVRAPVEKRRNSIGVASSRSLGMEHMLPNQSTIWGDLSTLEPFYASGGGGGSSSGGQSGSFGGREIDLRSYWDEQP
jgi:serine/threonine protein kinase